MKLFGTFDTFYGYAIVQNSKKQTKRKYLQLLSYEVIVLFIPAVILQAYLCFTLYIVTHFLPFVLMTGFSVQSSPELWY